MSRSVSGISRIRRSNPRTERHGTATIFVVGFVNHIAKGALLLVSDNPMTPDGVKTTRSDQTVTEQYAKLQGMQKMCD